MAIPYWIQYWGCREQKTFGFVTEIYYYVNNDITIKQGYSAKVVSARKMVLELLLSSGNHNCAIDNAGGEDWTGLQFRVQNDEGTTELCPAWGDCKLQDLVFQYQVNAGRLKHLPVQYPAETVNPLIIRDFSRCILCGRCVQASNDVQVCPTGALVEKKRGQSGDPGIRKKFAPPAPEASMKIPIICKSFSAR